MTVYGIVTIFSELDLRTIEDTSVVNFLVSFVETIGKGDNKKLNFHSISVEAWAGAADYLYTKCRKGDKLYLQGILRQNRWEDKDGNKHQKNVVRIQNFQLMNQEISNN